MEREIEVSAVVRAAPARARQAVIDDLGSILGGHGSDEERRTRQFVCELGVGLRSGTSVHQEVVVQAGAPEVVDDVLLVPVRIQAREHTRLFPTFEGEVGVSPERQGTRIRLVGHASVPGGHLGHLGEGVVAGHDLARDSLAHYVEEIARRVDTAVDRRLTSMSPAPLHEGEREHGHR